MLPNITIHDNGSGFCVDLDGLPVLVASSLGNAWRHIKWMYEVASQRFTVGTNRVPVVEWIRRMMKIGFLEEEYHYMMHEYAPCRA